MDKIGMRVGGLLLALLLWLTAAISPSATVSAAGDDAQSIIAGVLSFQVANAGVADISAWVAGPLVKRAGTTGEWYAIALAQYGDYDLTAYGKALSDYLGSHQVASATSRQKYALALIAAGRADDYVAATLRDSIGVMGIMSWVYGLHLLNNGYQSAATTRQAVIDKLLSLQLPDGGWALKGTAGDVDITAMTLQALAPHTAESAVSAAVEQALTLLSVRQLADGNYTGYGVSNPESAAQVLCTLSSLGIDCRTDSRFIKGGRDLLAVLADYRLADGSYCHQLGGGFNETATSQVFYAAVAYQRMQQGKGPLFVLDRRPPLSTTAPSATGQSTGTASSAPGTTTGTAAGVTGTGTPPAAVTDATASTAATSDPAAVPDKTTSSADAAATTASGAKPSASAGVGYKPYAILAVLVLAGVAVAVTVLTGRKTAGNYILIAVAAGLLILLVAVTDFRSVSSYQEQDLTKSDVIGTVTVSIHCDTAVDKQKELSLPEDGVILPATAWEIAAGDTAYSVLREICLKNGIALDAAGEASTAYVTGIGHLYELACGPLSGWMYCVDGEFPDRSSSQYALRDGQVIRWLYTCDMGDDIGNTPTEEENG